MKTSTGFNILCILIISICVLWGAVLWKITPEDPRQEIVAGQGDTAYQLQWYEGEDYQLPLTISVRQVSTDSHQIVIEIGKDVSLDSAAQLFFDYVSAFAEITVLNESKK